MYDDSVRVAPLDKILAETDAPFAAPVPHRGARNEPIYTREVIQKIAELKGVSGDDMAAHITKNAQKIFTLR
jgi:TatD DNase family protein